jgi:hypothetical protein
VAADDFWFRDARKPFHKRIPGNISKLQIENSNSFLGAPHDLARQGIRVKQLIVAVDTIRNVSKKD